MSEIERVAEECLECGACLGECEFLSRFCESPREYAESILAGELAGKVEIAFSCNLCGSCLSACPQNLDLRKFFVEVRTKGVEEGVKLPRNLKFLKTTQDYVNSDAFTLSLPRAGEARCDQVLFPGCHLAGYSPDLVLSTYRWLRERIPNLGIVLQCCGAPDLDTGDESSYADAVNRLEATLDGMGAKEVIAACPNCIYHFKNYAPQIKVTNLYEVMAAHWLEESAGNGNGTFSLHDPCKARAEEGMQQAARTLIKRAGYQVECVAESGAGTRCCGQGGLVPYASMSFAAELSKQRAEALGEQVLTYCASCRDAFAPYKPAVHILDVLFNYDLRDASLKPAHKPSEIKENQAYLKNQLLNDYAAGT